ncbi:ribonuclease H-like domain-containing protein [Tanacetum coccineum]
MEFESTNSGTTVKLPILKLGEYEMWVIRIKQYFQIQNYALWEVIENGDSWVSVPETAQENGTLVTKMSIPVTAEEKTNKKNNVKARSLLLMALPNEHQLTFSQYPDAKSMFAAIETPFGGNTTTKKTQKTLLKQHYKHFSATSAESFDSIFNRLQKIMNKPEVNSMSIDDLYNNFKIVEQKVKKSVSASSGAQNLAFMSAPSTSSTNDANTASPQVSTASPNVNVASPQVSTASFSDNVVFAFMVKNPNGSNLLHQDLEQIHKDDLEAMDLKWQLSLLSIRAKRWSATTVISWDLARECRAPRSKKGQFKNQDNTRKQGNNKDKSSKVMFAIDGVGFDWSDTAEEQVQTNMALMAFSDSEVYTDKTCSKTCLKNYETLKKQCDDLIVKLIQTEFTAATYKRGLATVEDQLITYRKNEVLFSEEVTVLKREVACKDYKINMLKSEFEKVKQEKDGIEFKIEKFDKASKDLDQLLGSQITDKSKKDLRYSAVPPPHPLIYNRPKNLDLSYSGLDEFKEPEFKGYGLENSEQESNVVCDKKSDNFKENSNESLVEEQVSQDTSSFVESSLNVDKETIFLGNQRNWNGQMSNQLEKDFVMYNKACFICGSFNHLQINCDNHQRKGIVSRNNYNRVDAKIIHPSVHRNMSPRVVLLKTGLTSLNTVRHVNTAHPKSAVLSAKSMLHFSKQAQSTAQRPFYKQTTLTRRSVHTTKRHYYTGRPRAVNTSRASHNKMIKDLLTVCSRHMTGNIAYLSDFKEFDGGYVAFGRGAYGGRITGKGTFKLILLDENQILLKIPRKDNMYSFDMKNIVPKESLTCLVAKATLDESMLWHRRLGHINFKNINKLVKDNLIEPELGNFTMDVVEDIFDNPTREPRVHVPNILPTHPTLHLDSNFTLSSDSLESDLAVSFPSGTRNKIFDPGIFIGVQSMRFLSLDEFSISFIRDLPFPVIGTFLPFSPQNEDKVFNPGILASNEEKSPHLLSYRGFNPSKIIFDFSESPMMIYGGDIPILMFNFSISNRLDKRKFGGSVNSNSVNKNNVSRGWVTHAIRRRNMISFSSNVMFFCAVRSSPLPYSCFVVFWCMSRLLVFEASRARGFVLRSLELHILLSSFGSNS